MKNIFKKLFIACVAVTGFGSCNYLDLVPDDIASIESAFTNRAVAFRFLCTCYSYMPQIGSYDRDPAITGGVETWHIYQSVWGQSQPVRMQRGEQGTNDPLLDYWNGTGGLPSLYQGIRDVNIFLENLDKPVDLGELEKRRWIGEALFLKAFYHYYLMKCYGPIPIVDKNLPISATPDEVKVYRDPIDDVVDYCDKLFMEAYEYLPDYKQMTMNTEAGRADKEICLAIRAEMLVYAASPLFNGNTDYAGLIDNRGVQLFNQVYDNEKWKRAADACKLAIDACEEAGKDLYRAVAPVTLTQNKIFQLQTTLRQIIGDKWNCELIWGETQNGGWKGRQQMATPRLIRLSPNNADLYNSISAEWAPTINAAEKFYTNHGVPMSEDKEWIDNEWYVNRYNVRPTPSTGDEKYYVHLGDQTCYMHFNREPRFYASIGFDKGIYYGSGKYDWGRTDEGELYYAKCLNKEVTGQALGSRYSITGYNAKKMHDYSADLSYDSWPSYEYSPFPILRLADLYLLYAESLNEYSGPSATVYDYIDLVRDRAGLEGVVESWSKYSINPSKPTTKAGMRDIIKQERSCELAFESKYYWDIRRWKDMINVYNEQPKGWNIAGETPEEYYHVVNVARIRLDFNVKDYFMPLRDGTIITNKNLIQNYGW